MPARRAADLRRRLLAWYDAHRRELPWRAGGEPPDPYRVWVSEVMLQQTRVETVRAYYARWLERFPNLETLARSPLEEVLKAWEGLGYYTRAKNLHRAARSVMVRHGGAVPDEPDAFRALPGVGPYTAGAVMSIAFGREEPLVDGNVRRVFARWLDEPNPSRATLWALAGALVRGERPGDLNQAIMELGATLCTPRRPRCDLCPVRRDCAAAAAGTQELRPERRRPRAVPLELHGVAIVAHGDRLLLVRRPVDSRLGGLWEFPGACHRDGESAAAAAVRAVREQVGLRVAVGGPAGSIEHALTHVRIRYEAFFCTLTRNPDRPAPAPNWGWVDLEGIRRLPLPRAQRKLAALAPAAQSSTRVTKHFR